MDLVPICIVSLLVCEVVNTAKSQPSHIEAETNGCYFPENIFTCIFSNKNKQSSIKTSLKFVPEGPINNIPALVQRMAWRWPGDKPLSEPMMVRLLTHICVTWPQWVNTWRLEQNGCHQWVWVMACHLLRAKPLPEPMLTFCQSEFLEQMLLKFQLKCKNFLSRTCIWNCCL